MEDVRDLKELQIDALREVANIGAGHAATALSQLTNRKIMISVPQINIVRLEEVPDLLGNPQDVVAAVLMHMLGDLTGRTLLLFPESVGRRVCDMLLRRPVGTTAVFDALEQSCLKEAGNILAGAYLNALSDFMGMLLLPSVPSLVVDLSAAVLTTTYLNFGHERDFVFCVETEFHIDSAEGLRGHFLLLPDLASLKAIFDAIRRRRHGSGQADGVEDGLERRQIGEQQEVPPQPLGRVDVELGLDAEHEVALVPEVEVRGREHRRGEVHHETRHGRQQQHPHEVGQRVHVGAGQDVAGFLEARLLEHVEHVRRPDRPPQQHVAQPPPHRLREEQQGASRQIPQHVHQHGGDDVLRVAEQVRDFFEPRDVDLRHADHDPAVGELRQRRRGVAGADVRHLAQRVDLELFQVPDVLHLASHPYRSPPASRINAGIPSPMMVAPLNTGSVPWGASKPFTTISCCPSMPSTTSPARRSPISSTMTGARSGGSPATPSSRRRCTSGTTRSRSTIASRPSTVVVAWALSSTVSATYVSGSA